MVRWRVVAVTLGLSRKQRDARARSEVLTSVCRECDRQIVWFEGLGGELSEKCNRATEEKIETSLEFDTTLSNLTELTTSAEEWEENFTSYLEKLSTLINDEPPGRCLEEGRRAAEETVLKWCVEILDDPAVVNFSSAWKNGEALLKLLSIVTGKDITTWPTTAERCVELAGELLRTHGVEILPLQILKGASDVIACTLYRIWSRFSATKQYIPPTPPTSDAAVLSTDMTAQYFQLRNWIRTTNLLSNYFTTLFVMRAHGNPNEVLTTREIDVLTATLSDITQFSRRSLTPWPVPEPDLTHADYVELTGTVQKHCETLSKSYRNYSDETGRMDYAKYMRFLIDCGLFSVGFRKAQAARHFARSVHVRSQCDSSFNVKTDTVSGGESLSGGEFVKMLVFLAYVRSKEDRRMKGKKIQTVFDVIIQNEVAPRAGSSKAGAFRKLLWHDAVQIVVGVYRKNLQVLFAVSSSRDSEVAAPSHPTRKNRKPPNMDPNTLSLDEWRLLLTSFTLYTPTFTQKQADSIFRHFQPTDAKEQCLVYSEFEEALCCVAAYLYPNPYHPLTTKIKMFLKQICRKIPGLQEEIAAIRAEPTKKRK